VYNLCGGDFAAGQKPRKDGGDQQFASHGLLPFDALSGSASSLPVCYIQHRLEKVLHCRLLMCRDEQ
jgi:hypothetical protein